MNTYFLFGKYSSDAIKKISANRTDEAVDLIKKCGGEVKAMYALLGKYDLALIVDFDCLEDAMRASLGLTRLTSIGFSTSPALSVEEFDRLVAKI